MEKRSMCRICLVADVRMCLIGNTYLQNVYETLTLMPFVTKDNRPVSVCYMCRASLENCHRLRERCLRSEELYTQMVNKMYSVGEVSSSPRLTLKHPLIQLSTGGTPGSVFYKYEVKAEPIDPEDVTIEPSEEFDPEGFSRPSSFDERFSVTIKVESEDDTSKYSQSKDHLFCIDRHLQNVNFSIRQSMTKGPLYGYRLEPFYVGPKIIGDKIWVLITPLPTPLGFYRRALVAEESTVTEQKTTSKRTNRRTSNGEKPYQCDVCYKNLKSRKTFKKHKCKPSNSTPNPPQPFECDTCNKYFSTCGNLRRHVRLIHSSELLHQCKVCAKRFVRKDHLENHSRIHNGEKPYQCDICKTYFSQKASLCDHIRAHAEGKLYQCHVCQKCFNHKGNLKRHLRTHNDDKPYQCEVCYKRFSRSGHLYIHMRVHTREKPYKCKSCDLRFCKESNLNLHVIHKHSGERRFKCQVCNKRFNHRGNYNVHVQLHTSDRPYQCDVCNKCFGSEDNLKKHYSKHKD